MQHVTDRVVGDTVEAPAGTTIGEVSGVRGDCDIVEPAPPLDNPVVSRPESYGSNATSPFTVDDVAVAVDELAVAVAAEHDDTIEPEAV